MANLSITAANVGIAGAQADVRSVLAGENVSHGQLGYPVGGAYKLAKATTDAEANCQVVFLGSATTGQYVLALFPGGRYKVGATVAVGTQYAVSATAGAICPIADLGAGDRVTPIGVADSTTTMVFDPRPSGVTHA